LVLKTRPGALCGKHGLNNFWKPWGGEKRGWEVEIVSHTKEVWSKKIQRLWSKDEGTQRLGLEKPCNGGGVSFEGQIKNLPNNKKQGLPTTGGGRTCKTLIDSGEGKTAPRDPQRTVKGGDKFPGIPGVLPDLRERVGVMIQPKTYLKKVIIWGGEKVF